MENSVACAIERQRIGLAKSPPGSVGCAPSGPLARMVRGADKTNQTSALNVYMSAHVRRFAIATISNVVAEMPALENGENVADLATDLEDGPIMGSGARHISSYVRACVLGRQVCSG